jgi:outer membrane receptor protein involved in Fe transport
MRFFTRRLARVAALACIPACYGFNTSEVRGVVHDPQHRPLGGAAVSLTCEAEQFSRTTTSDTNGEFVFSGVPWTECVVTVEAKNFRTDRQTVADTAKSEIIHFQLELSQRRESVDVTSSRLETPVSTVTSATSREEIARTPGTDQTNSLGMITDFVPGAYMVHDMLHMRGGHQVNWFLDGIPVVNTNIAANVAPLINPKNVDELETERGGFSSQYGDRTYGFFNVVTPTGFDRNNDIELIASAGNFYSTDDQVNIAGHGQKYAYYASIDGNRSELGLGTPTSQVIHDQQSGIGGFGSILFNVGPKDQIRAVVSARGDHYQIPNTPDDQAAGIRDVQLERDTLMGMNWTHTFGEGVLFSLAPYYHYNNAHYVGGPFDTPSTLDDNARSTYFGGRAVLQLQKGRHNARVGMEIWGQHDNTSFQLTSHVSSDFLSQQEHQWANSNSAFLEDQFQATRWLTLNLGLRLTHYAGLVNENAADPRIGAAIRIPRLQWIIRGYYAYYYQPPPLNSISGPLLKYALTQGVSFIAVPGERDVQHDFGLTIPIKGWALEADNFHTSARNFLDHDVIGDSGIFVPLTDLGARISGTEVSLRSPELGHMLRARIAYSNQIAQGIGPITGGLFEDAPTGAFLLDHDQRNTLSAVFAFRLPHRWWATPVYNYGSGFLEGNGPGHLPPHSTVDLSIGKAWKESWSASVNTTNIANSRYMQDDSNTFGGTHFVNPRQIYGELRFRFHP